MICILKVGTVIYRAHAYDLDEQPVLRFSIDKELSSGRNEDGVPVTINDYDYIGIWDLNTIDGTLRIVR